MAPKFKDGDVLATVSGKWVTWAHTVAAYREDSRDCDVSIEELWQC